MSWTGTARDAGSDCFAELVEGVEEGRSVVTTRGRLAPVGASGGGDDEEVRDEEVRPVDFI